MVKNSYQHDVTWKIMNHPGRCNGPVTVSRLGGQALEEVRKKYSYVKPTKRPAMAGVQYVWGW